MTINNKNEKTPRFACYYNRFNFTASSGTFIEPCFDLFCKLYKARCERNVYDNDATLNLPYTAYPRAASENLTKKKGHM